MQKIKLVPTPKQKALRGLTIQVDDELYQRMGRTIQELKITKRVLVQTAIIKILDDIESLGVEL